MAIPFWRPLPSEIEPSNKRDGKEQDDSSSVSSSSFGNREGHVAVVLSSIFAKQSFLICFGGWVDADGSSDVIMFDLGFTQKQWKVCGSSKIALRANSTLVVSESYPNDAILFGGMDLDSCECRNDLHIVSLTKSENSGCAIAFSPIEVGESIDAPCPRQRHSAFLFDHFDDHDDCRKILFIFGGENDDSEMLNDLWMIDLAADHKKWIRVDLPIRIAPRAAACMIGKRMARDCFFAIALLGGLCFDEGGAQTSVNQVVTFAIQLDATSGTARSTFVSFDGKLIPRPVNTLLAVPISSGFLLFGGKDTAKGNDDLLIVDFVGSSLSDDENESGANGGNEKALVALRAFATIACPFIEAKKEDEDDEAISRLDRKKQEHGVVASEENCWPHWRYAGAAASWKQKTLGDARESYFVACVGGTCRHEDLGCEVVIAKF